MSANIQILGNLGRKPEQSVSENGTLVTSFSIASNSVRRTPQGSEKQTDWFRVTAFGEQAAILAKYAERGTRLLVSGKLTFSPWKDQEGRPQVNANLLLQDFQFVGDGGINQRDDENVAKCSTSADQTQEYSVETVISDFGGDVQEIQNQNRAF